MINGIPASGKTTAVNYLEKNFSQIYVLRFGSLIFQYKKKKFPQLKYEDLRKKSSSLIGFDDIKTIDNIVIEVTKKHRSSSHVLIESHGVTREDFGFRVTPYTHINQIHKLKLHAIVFISCKPTIVYDRINKNAKGRKPISQNEVVQNIRLQECLSMIYSTQAGCPLYVIDNSGSKSSFQKQIDLLFNKLLI